MIRSGNDSILFIRIGQNFVPIGCLTSNSFSESAELLPTTTQQSQGWRTFRANLQGYNLTFTGLQVFTLLGSPNLVSLDRLQLIKRENTLIDWEERIGANLVQRGKGYLIELTAENPVNEDATFSGTIQGVGRPEMILSGVVLGSGTGEAVEDGEGNPVTP